MLKLKSLGLAFSRLGKRERLILYWTVFFVSVALLDRLIIHPVIDKMRSLDEDTKKTESGIKKSLHILAHKDRILADTEEYSSFLSSLESEEEKTVSIQKEIENIADKSGIYLADMKPAGLKEAGSFKKYSVNLNCEGEMSQFVDFMYNIESSGALLTIEKYQITPNPKDVSMARYKVTISTIVVR